MTAARSVKQKVEKMKKCKGLPTYGVTMDELSAEQGVTVMSIVDMPAVQSDFLKFSKTESQKKVFSFNEEKRVVTGCALRADFPIYRENEKGEGFYVTFTPDAIYRFVQKFMKEGRISDVNTQHSTSVNGIFLFESYILTDKLKLEYPEFRELSIGSWMVSYKIENQDVWNEIKAGNLKGFSVEVTANLEEPEDLQAQKDIRELEKLINILNEL